MRPFQLGKAPRGQFVQGDHPTIQLVDGASLLVNQADFVAQRFKQTTGGFEISNSEFDLLASARPAHLCAWTFISEARSTISPQTQYLVCLSQIPVRGIEAQVGLM